MSLIHERDLSAHTVWQVKASTLCNLRCRYCYEWDRLADPKRMTLAQWRRVLEAAMDYRGIRERRHGIASRIVIMWHGGEPLLLPPAYVRDVLSLQREILSRSALAAGDFVNAVQTNLTRANATLELMVAAGFVVSASLDFAVGARIDIAERETHSHALANLTRLLARGVRCGVTLVLGRHNHDRLSEIHDELEALGTAWLRIVPMFAPPADAPGGDLALREEDVIAALARLFAHRLRHGNRLAVYPLDNALQAVVGRRAEVTIAFPDRRLQGETRLVVHPDGTLAAQGGTAAPDCILGNVFTQSALDIFSSRAHRLSLDQDDDLRARHCSDCLYRKACDRRPLFANPRNFATGPCPVDSRLMTEIDSQLAGARRRPRARPAFPSTFRRDLRIMQSAIAPRGD